MLGYMDMDAAPMLSQDDLRRLNETCQDRLKRAQEALKEQQARTGVHAAENTAPEAFRVRADDVTHASAGGGQPFTQLSLVQEPPLDQRAGDNSAQRSDLQQLPSQPQSTGGREMTRAELDAWVNTLAARFGIP